MPGAYAHLKHARHVLHRLPDDISIQIYDHIELYEIGLHGPDILFYDRPIMPNKVNRLARSTHYKSGSQVFRSAWDTAVKHTSEGGYMAYLYGYLCHFALDSTAHGYVRGMAAGEVGHHELEMEFDRKLMIDDGLDPFTCDLTRHIVPSVRNSIIISSFYPGITAGDVERSLKSMMNYIDLLRLPDCNKRKAILKAFHLTGHYKQLKGLFMSLEPNPKCEESNKVMYSLLADAENVAIRLITSLEPSMTGKVPMDDQYKLNFESQSIE